MHTIKIVLSDAAAGTWTTEHSPVPVATGVRISENRDYWKLVEDIQPAIEQWLGRRPLDGTLRTDGMLVLLDPAGAGLDGEIIPEGEVVCQFRLLAGTVEPMV